MTQNSTTYQTRGRQPIHKNSRTFFGKTKRLLKSEFGKKCGKLITYLRITNTIEKDLFYFKFTSTTLTNVLYMLSSRE
jgi:hypothetical protein